MKLQRQLLFLLILFSVFGCASTEVTGRDQKVTGQIPRPAHVWVNDFAATSADLPAHSGLRTEALAPNEKQTAKEIAEGRKLGRIISTGLIKELRDLGLPAEHAAKGTKPQVNDIVIEGYILSFDEGDATKRVAVGFKAGMTDLKVAVEGLQMTAQGLRELGSLSTDAEGSKTPGAAVGGASMLITHNPLGLIATSGMKAYGEVSGSNKIEARAQKTAEEITEQLKPRFKELGWI